MLKSLSIFGWFNFPLMTIFLFLAVFLGSFVFWRKLHHEGAYEEMEIFDDFLGSLLLGFLVGRVTFILTNFDTFGLNVWQWVNFVSHPGINLLAAVGGAGVFLFNFTKKRKVDAWVIADFWAEAASLGLFFYEVGRFFDGGGGGNLTQLPWGVTFPGMLSKVHPEALYSAGFFLGLFFYLSWAEFHYRTFDWYRRGKSNAQAGFIVGFLLLATGLFWWISLIWRPANYIVAGINFDLVTYVLLALVGMGMIYFRSGRSLFKGGR